MSKILAALDAEFAKLHEAAVALARAVPAEKLYWQPREAAPSSRPGYSCGEHLLRSAAAVEQTFGGLTASLWDDPFEWTLPETLPAPAHVEEYLREAEATRRRGFALFASDGDLVKEIATPSGEMRTLVALLIETLARSAQHQGRAYATFRLFSGDRLPRI